MSIKHCTEHCILSKEQYCKPIQLEMRHMEYSVAFFQCMTQVKNSLCDITYTSVWTGQYKPRTVTPALAHNPNTNPIPLTLTLKMWLQTPEITAAHVSDLASVLVWKCTVYMRTFTLYSL